MSDNPLKDIPDIFAPSHGEGIPGLTVDELLPDAVRRANIAEHERRVREYLAKIEAPPRQAG